MSIDVSALIANEVCPALNAAVVADLVFWTADELYQFADDAVKDASRMALLFVSVAPLALGIGAGPTNLPAGTVAIIAGAFSGQALTAANAAEIEALDDNWENTTGPPANWLQDVGISQVRVYPAPTVAGSLSLILQGFPATPLSVSNVSIEAPAGFAGYLVQEMIGRARGKQSDAMLADVAHHAVERSKMYDTVFAQYWGAGE